MKKMNLENMENIEGGNRRVSCAIGLIGFGAAAVGLVTATGGMALAAAVIGYSFAPVGAALSCFG